MTVTVKIDAPVRIDLGFKDLTNGGDYTYPFVFNSRYFDRTDPERRVRPLGVELLFNGTNVSYNKIATIHGVASRYFNLYGTSYVETTLVPATYQGSGAGVLIGVDDWANDVRSKLKDQSVNLAQAFAERKQAASMFVDFGTRILKARKALKRADVGGIFKALTGVKEPPKGWKRKFSTTATQLAGDHWLAWQYGIRPLISDIRGSIEEIYKVRSVQPLIRRVTKTVRKGETVGTGTPNATGWGSKATIICYAEFDSGASGFDQTAQRLGLTDPIMLAWELIPYSFVIDWFINVGDFIHATGTVSGLKRVGISVTTRYSVTAQNSDPLYGGVASYSSLSVNRQFLTTLPGASLKFSSTPFGDLLAGNFSRVFSALSLARQPLSTSLYPPLKRGR